MGDTKFCGPARMAACAIGLVLYTAGSPAHAENLYKFRDGGREYYGYQDALLALDISNGTVTGELRPLLGDKTAPINVHGTNPRDGALELVIDLPDGPKTYKFTKKIEGQRIVWKSVPIDNVESGLSLYRYLDRPLSDAALTLGEYECGARYRSMVAELLPETTKRLLDAFLATNQQASALPITYKEYDEKAQAPWSKKTSISLGDFLKLQLSRAKANRDEPQFQAPVQFETAVGTEAYLAKWLRGSGVIKFADLDPGGCDGMDASYFAVDRGLLFDGDEVSQAKFEQYIETRLREFVARDEKGKAWQFRIGQARVKILNLPTKPIAYRVRIYAASEITRQVPGWWDAFWVTFEPGPPIETEKDKIAVVITVDRLKGSKRSSGNSSPPDDGYFTRELELSDEAEVTAAIAKYFARRDRGWCVVELAADDNAEKHQAVCNGMAAR